MTKWEYKVAFTFDQLEQLGKEGWELVTVDYMDGCDWFYLKRPLTDDND